MQFLAFDWWQLRKNLRLRNDFGLYRKMGDEAPSKMQEIPLKITFGEDTAPTSWMAFKSHFELVKKANVMRGVQSWNNKEYRALMCRLQMRGTAASYVEQQAVLDPLWASDDEAIMDRLSQMYYTSDAIEVRIIRFEEATQMQDECLSDFMTRLQQLASQSFASEPSDIVRKRVIWRFLAGLRDREVRSQLIKEKWMESDEKAKSYDEVMKIALAALSCKRATQVTGMNRNNGAATAQVKVVEYNLDYVSEEEPSITQAQMKNVQSVTQKESLHIPNRGKGPQMNRNQRKFKCFYCNKYHPGGWLVCSKRLKEDPNWKPSSNGQQLDFRSSPL